MAYNLVLRKRRHYTGRLRSSRQTKKAPGAGPGGSKRRRVLGGRSSALHGWRPERLAVKRRADQAVVALVAEGEPVVARAVRVVAAGAPSRARRPKTELAGRRGGCRASVGPRLGRGRPGRRLGSTILHPPGQAWALSSRRSRRRPVDDEGFVEEPEAAVFVEHSLGGA